MTSTSCSISGSSILTICLLCAELERLQLGVEQNRVRRRGQRQDSSEEALDSRPAHVQQVTCIVFQADDNLGTTLNNNNT